MNRPRPSASDDSLAGALLLAHPKLSEATFRRTVILMSAHDTEGAMGIVLNRPLGRTLGSLGGDFACGALAAVPLYSGGPVEPRQLILCAWRPHGPEGESLQLLFGVDPAKAEELLTHTPGAQVRAYLGYTGWSGGQLEGELARDTWVVSSVLPPALTAPADDSLWRRALGALDPSWRLLADEPEDPGCN
jgi:putative transcriptional regulator